MKIEKKAIGTLIEAAARHYQVFAPGREDGNVMFQDVSASGGTIFDYLNSRTNPKELFLPRFETIFSFKKDEIVPPPPPENKFVIWGIRPCDVQGLRVLDQVYLTGDFPDVPYLVRRKNGVIVSLACRHPDPTCFCTAVGGHPAQEEGSDVIGYELDEAIVLKPVTAPGKDFIRNVARCLQPATESDWDRLAKHKIEAAEKITTEIDLEAVKKSLGDNFYHPYWRDIHRKCIGCGICTYLCPTCYCFDLTDETSPPLGKRLRSWDSCMFRLFTLHASGHNPRPSGEERFRQRVMHKFKYLPDNCQVLGCTGCGRCLRECPVNLDLREVLHKIIQMR